MFLARVSDSFTAGALARQKYDAGSGGFAQNRNGAKEREAILARETDGEQTARPIRQPATAPAELARGAHLGTRVGGRVFPA
jgi:hypothetical protein